MKIVIGITSVLLLAVFSVAYLYFSSLTVDSRSNNKTLEAIPASTSFIFNFTNDKSLYEIFREYKLFEAIAGEDNQREFNWLKSLLFDSPDLYNFTQGQKAFLSVHHLPKDGLQFLWVMPLLEDINLEQLENYLSKNKTVIVGLQEGTAPLLIEIKNKTGGRTFYLGIEGRIARGSFSKTLLLESLNRSGKKISKDFIEEINNALIKDGDALASLFINYSEPGVLNPFFKVKATGNFGLLSSVNSFSSLLINYKSDALMFNGLTRLAEKEQGFLKLFLSQKPVKNTIKRVIPVNMSNAICFGLSDYQLFNKELKSLLSSRQELTGLDQLTQRIITETGINPDRDIKKLWGNEFTNIQLSTYESLAVISITNGRELQFFLEPLSSYYSGDLRKMNYENMFYYYFGDPVKKYTKPYFAVVDNLVIISNSPTTVQKFLGDYNSQRSLETNESFSRFDQLIADQSNISFLLNFKNSRDLFNTLLKEDYAQIPTSKKYGFKDFYGFSYQLTSNGDEFLTNFYLGNEYKAALSVDSLVYSIVNP